MGNCFSTSKARICDKSQGSVFSPILLNKSMRPLLCLSLSIWKHAISLCVSFLFIILRVGSLVVFCAKQAGSEWVVPSDRVIRLASFRSAVSGWGWEGRGNTECFWKRWTPGSSRSWLTTSPQNALNGLTSTEPDLHHSVGHCDLQNPFENSSKNTSRKV